MLNDRPCEETIGCVVTADGCIPSDRFSRWKWVLAARHNQVPPSAKIAKQAAAVESVLEKTQNAKVDRRWFISWIIELIEADSQKSKEDRFLEEHTRTIHLKIKQKYSIVWRLRSEANVHAYCSNVAHSETTTIEQDDPRPQRKIFFYFRWSWIPLEDMSNYPRLPHIRFYNDLSHYHLFYVTILHQSLSDLSRLGNLKVSSNKTYPPFSWSNINS